MKALSTFQLGKITLKNHFVMAPMCMFKVQKHDGCATDFHRIHYGARALGGMGLIIVESTGVSPEGRITDNDLGLYREEQIQPLSEIVKDAHAAGAKIAIQLNHAGRKSQCTDGVTKIYAPSAIPFSQESRTPLEMSPEEIKKTILDFEKAAIRAKKCGFDGIELHAAHGFLLNEFLNPKTNQRTDKYGDPLVFIAAVIQSVKRVFAGEVWLRVSANDYNVGTVNDLIPIIRHVKKDISCVHVSSGGLFNVKPTAIYPGYQVADAWKIQQECQLPVIGVGLLDQYDLATYFLETQQLDLLALGRGVLKNPNWVIAYANHYQKLNEVENSPYKQAYH